jgi:hypothetical protein
MANLKTVFIKTNSLMAVIHVESLEQAFENTRIALGEGADGVFLINHAIDHRALGIAYRAIRINWPDARIGLNFLDLSPLEATKFCPASATALWVDNAEIDSRARFAIKDQQRHRKTRGNWNQLYFGGVAFKYQHRPYDLYGIAAISTEYVDVVTTSGDATGQPPTVKKIQTMRQAIGNHPLAIASGMTPENVGDYMEYANVFMVATGISDNKSELNPMKVREFVRRINS